ncbi:MAG: response regulator [Rhodobacteraceae bacterium]|nr:response regulator [Paracoccaceae bacterium]
MDQQNSDAVPKGQGQELLPEMDSGALLSHDLRSAVSDIIGGLKLLDLSHLGDKNRRQIERISASAGLLYRLLEKTTDAEAGGSKISRRSGITQINLSELLDGMEHRWSARAEAKGVALGFVREADPSLVVVCDRLALERLLANLLDNAIKFTDAGRILLTARVEADSKLQFEVRDNGPGFSPDAMNKLFSLGGRPDRSDKPGSGMGLFIAQKMAQRLNGEISLTNSPQGASVLVQLPLQVDGKQTVDIGSDWSGGQPKQRLAGLHVLLAEDNKTNQVVASQMLRSLGADVSIAADGIEAWNLLDLQDFDLAVLDIEMPRKSGLELIRDIRTRKDAKAQMPLIALTAYVMREHRERIMASGANGIIAKPLMNIDDFGESIEELLAFPKAEFGKTERKAGNLDDSPVDMYVYNSLCKTIGEAAFADLLVKLLDDLSMVQERLRQAFANRDANQARGASHVLISLAGAIGATRLQEIAQSLNTAAHKDDNRKISEYEGRSLQLLDELTVFLDSARRESKED